MSRREVLVEVALFIWVAAWAYILLVGLFTR